MAVDIKHRFTIAEYYKMAEDEILSDSYGCGSRRTELINGEIIQMSPIGRLHSGCINRLTNLLTSRLSGLAVVAIQNPVILNDNSEPQPDVAILRYRQDFYSLTHPTPADILLIIEVADTTLKFDREVKVPLYADAGIVEVWIVNLQEQVVERYWQLKQGKYQNKETYGMSKSLNVLDLAIAVDEIF
jgi:Uma2 family endonuclease